MTNELQPIQPTITLEQRADRIRALVGDARKAIIEIGKELLLAKSEMEHGQWLPWLKKNFGWSNSTAQNYMNVARAFGKFPTVGNLVGVSIEGKALYYLSAKGVTEDTREQAIVQIKQGKKVTLADAKRLVGEVAAAAKVDRKTARKHLADMGEIAKPQPHRTGNLPSWAIPAKAKFVPLTTLAEVRSACMELSTEIQRLRAEEEACQKTNDWNPLQITKAVWTDIEDMGQKRLDQIIDGWETVVESQRVAFKNFRAEVQRRRIANHDVRPKRKRTQPILPIDVREQVKVLEVMETTLKELAVTMGWNLAEASVNQP
jgi:hypothetical protein